MNFKEELINNILIFDGAYGTQFQAFGLEERDYRNAELQGHAGSFKSNHELLNLTRPEVVESIHAAYIAAGSRIITANTFNANAISQADYGLEDWVAKMAREGVFIAKRAAAKAKDKVWVAGTLGPTNKTLSLSADVEHPEKRAVAFDEMEAAYYQQLVAMEEAGVDIILIETIFDTLNAKAAIAAYERLYSQKQRKPLWISATITDLSGRTLSGQTLEAFYISIAHAQPTLVGLNCALGAQALFPYVRELSRLADCAVAVHPNAGLPNELGGYDESPQTMAQTLAQMAQEGLVNVVGGCCGTTPKHIAAIAQSLKGVAPRRIPSESALAKNLTLAGIEPLVAPREGGAFLFIGERANVTGSPKFARLIREGDLAGALQIALEQVRGGANMLDISFDEALLDGKKLMGDFLRRLAAEPEISRVPLMIDSSSISIIEEGLKNAQGKCIVNSLSLKDGEEKFIANARLVRRYGAAAIVMAFDEQGQATDLARRLEICQRAYTLLIKEGWAADDIVFDPNILAVGTGIQEHANYARDFIEAIPAIKKLCPGTRVSGGVSNLSFAFRGQNTIREAIHAVFLYHAIVAGLDMAIVAAGMLKPYDSIDIKLREMCENLIFNQSADATEKLLEYAALCANLNDVASRAQQVNAWRNANLEDRLAYALLNGVGDYVEADATEALKKYPAVLQIIEGPLMDGMRKVGDLFGQGKMFLPQVVKSARVMKQFVAFLQPHLDKQKAAGAKKAKILLATVKGDVHDIGKNIVGVVLDCNGYDVVDLGVMVPCEKIIEAIHSHKPDIVGFSGLITPSLQEMIFNAQSLQKAGISTPILIGGATTSRLHTALKIAPEYSGAVVHVPDASRVVEVCQSLLNPRVSGEYKKQVADQYEQLRASYSSKVSLLSFADAREKAPLITPSARLPKSMKRTTYVFKTRELSEYIDWSPFFWAWGMKGVYPKITTQLEAKKLFDDAQAMIKRIIEEDKISVRGVMAFWPAKRIGEDVEVLDDTGVTHRFHFLRQQRSDLAKCGSLADYISPDKPDSLGGFVVSATTAVDEMADMFKQKGDDYSSLMVKALGDRLVEAAAELMHVYAREAWGQKAAMPLQDLIDEKYEGIRPASGYPSCPDHTEKALLWQLLDATAATGATLTENFAMSPASTVSGLYFHHAQSRYFPVGPIGMDQLADYAKRKNWTLEVAQKWLAANL